MAAYVEHAAYYVNQMDWYLNFFQQVFQMQVQKQRQGADGLREVWLEGGVQLCETTAPALEDGRCAHLCLIVEDLEQAREVRRAVGLGEGDRVLGREGVPAGRRVVVDERAGGLCVEPLADVALGAGGGLRHLPGTHGD